MNSLKTLFVVAVLAAIAGGVYISLHQGQLPDTTGDLSEQDWLTPPSIDLGAPARVGQAAGDRDGTPDGNLGSSFTLTTGEQEVDGPQSMAGQEPPAIPGPSDFPASEQLAVAPSHPAVGSPYSEAQPAGISTNNDRNNAGVAQQPVAQPSSEQQDQVGAEDDFAAEFDRFMAEMETAIKAGRLVDALQQMSLMYDDPRLSQQQRDRLVYWLDRLAYAVIYSPQHLLEPPYVVRPGDTLQKIAQQYNVPWQLLAKINGLEGSTVLVPGQQIKVLRGPFDADIDLERKELTLKLGGLYAGRFTIGVGPQVKQAAGTFFVEDKSAAATARDLWIKLNDQLTIHAVGEASQLGTDSASGAICVSEKDIEDLHTILSVGSRVRILR